MNGKRALILAAASALMLSGCFKFLPDSISGEQISERWVRLDFGVCPSYQGNCLNSDGESEVGFALLAIRAPKGTLMPAEISSVSGASVTLTPNKPYSRALNDLAPRGPHKRWFGYRALPGLADVQSAYFEVPMRVPRTFPREEFPVRPVIGSWTYGRELDCVRAPNEPPSLFGSGCITDPTDEGGLTNIMIPLTSKG